MQKNRSSLRGSIVGTGLEARNTYRYIRNGFRKGGFSSTPLDDVAPIAGTDDFEIPDDRISDAFQEWLVIDENEPTTTAVNEDDICSDKQEQRESRTRRMRWEQPYNFQHRRKYKMR